MKATLHPIFLFSFLSHIAVGSELAWDNEAADGLWVSPENWRPNAVPAPEDDLTISGGDYIIVPASANANQLTITGDPTLQGGQLNLSGNIDVRGNLSIIDNSTSALNLILGQTGGRSGSVFVDKSSSLMIDGIIDIGRNGKFNQLIVDGSVVAKTIIGGGVVPTLFFPQGSITVNAGGRLLATDYMAIGVENKNHAHITGFLSSGRIDIGISPTSNESSLSLFYGWDETGGKPVGSVAVVNGPVNLGVSGSRNMLYVGWTSEFRTTGALADVTLGKEYGADENYLRLDGSEMSVGGQMIVGRKGSGNSVTVGDGSGDISNSKLTSKGGIIGADFGADGNEVFVMGGHEFQLPNKWTLNDTLEVGKLGSHNLLNVNGNALLEITGGGDLIVGSSATSGGNRVTVVAGNWGDPMWELDKYRARIHIRDGGEVYLSKADSPQDFNYLEVSERGRVDASKFNLGPRSQLIFGMEEWKAATAGFISPSASIVGFGNGDLVTTGSSPSVVKFIQSDQLFELPNIIEGSASVHIESGGTTVLSGINTYSGTTLIKTGTLRLSGQFNNIPSSSIIRTVEGSIFDVSSIGDGFLLGSGQILEGTGTVTGRVEAPQGTTLRGGADFLGPGVLALSDTLILNGGSNLNVQLLADNLEPSNQASAGSLWSLVRVDGTISLSGLDLVPLAINLESGGSVTISNSVWSIMESAGGITINGSLLTTFTDYTSLFNVNSKANNGMAGWSLGAVDFKIISLGDSNRLYLQATPVPEAGAGISVLLAFSFLLGSVTKRVRGANRWSTKGVSFPVKGTVHE